MQARDFAFWLNGFFELGGGTEGLTKDQVELVKTHLALVFEHDESIQKNVGTHPVPKPAPRVTPNELPPFTWPGIHVPYKDRDRDGPLRMIC